MIIKTKFSIGDKVYFIGYETKQVKNTCNVCKGSGKIEIENETFNCPKCHGRKYTIETEKQKWRIVESVYKIGLVRPTIRVDGKDKTEYMMIETGIGSGSIYYEDDLFKSIKEAQKECDKRNKKRIE